jgi:hypothetical protein
MKSLHPSVKLWILARNAPIALNLRQPWSDQEDLIKELKKLAIDLGRSANNLIEEGIRVILDKYAKKSKK